MNESKLPTLSNLFCQLLNFLIYVLERFSINIDHSLRPSWGVAVIYIYIMVATNTNRKTGSEHRNLFKASSTRERAVVIKLGFVSRRSPVRIQRVATFYSLLMVKYVLPPPPVQGIAWKSRLLHFLFFSYSISTDLNR